MSVERLHKNTAYYGTYFDAENERQYEKAPLGLFALHTLACSNMFLL